MTKAHAILFASDFTDKVTGMPLLKSLPNYIIDEVSIENDGTNGWHAFVVSHQDEGKLKEDLINYIAKNELNINKELYGL